MMSKTLAEFIGTFMLMTAIGCNVASQSLLAPVAIASTLMVLIYAFGDVSGAKFNPSVTFALALAGKMKWSEVPLEVLAQCGGGVAAALFYTHGLYTTNPSVLVAHEGQAMTQAVIAEALFTGMLCLVVLSVAATAKNQPNQFFGLAIAFVIVAGGWAVGGVSQGIFNPAVALGHGLTPGSSTLTMNYLILGELLGSVLAVAMHHLVYPEEYSREEGLTTKIIAEFIGTFYLTLTVGLNVLAGNAYAPLSIAASLLCMIYALGSVSGAHFNPAVTTALLMSGNKVEGAPMYMLAQFAGGVSGAFLATGLIQAETPLALPSHGETFSMGEASCAEMCFTALLCGVVLSIATVEGKKVGEMAGLVVGSCITAGGFAVGAVSGGSFNPAVSAALAATGTAAGVPVAKALGLHLSSQVAGAAIAAISFWMTRREAAKDDETTPLRP